MKERKIQSYKSYRLERNESEKKLHDAFIQGFSAKYLEEIVGKKLSDDDLRLIVTIIQWLGTPIGEGFLREQDFCKKEDFYKREQLFAKKISNLEDDLEKIPDWIKAIYL